MNDKGMAVFLIVDSFILFTLVVVKTVLFFKAARKKTIKRWFYFNTYDIEDAPSESIKLLRKKQNTFTIVIFVAIIVSALVGFWILASE